MARTKISEFSSTAASNTDIDGINIAEGCAPSGINDAIRELMSQLKDWQAGTSNDPYVIGSSGSLTLNQGTANGVLYLNGSKVATSGSALTFNGTTLNVGNATNTYSGQFITKADASGGYAYATDNTVYQYLSAISGGVAIVGTATNHPYAFNINGSEQMRLTSTGLGIGTSSPANKLDVQGTSVSGQIAAYIKNNATSGQYTSTGLSLYSYDGTAVNPGASIFQTASTFGYQQISANQLNIYGKAAGGMRLVTANSGPIKFATTTGTDPDFATTQMTLDSSGNLGLGVTPSAWSLGKAFEIGNTGQGVWSVASGDVLMFQGGYYNSGWKYATTGGRAGFFEINDGSHVWKTAPSGTAGNAITFTQAMTLDSSGYLMVGTTTPYSAAGGGTSQGTFEKSQANRTNLSVSNQTNNSSAGAALVLAAYGADWILESGSSTKSSNSLTFSYGATERARIDSSGNLLVGTTSTFGGGTGNFYVTKTGDVDLVNFWSQAAAGNGTAMYVRRTNTGNFTYFVYGTSTNVGSISTNGTTTSYNITSDQRLKENIQDADSSSSLIDSLQVRKFDWKTDQTHQRYGFIAQELIQVAPEAVHQPANEKDMMAVDYSKLVPMLVKEIQSLRKRLADAGID